MPSPIPPLTLDLMEEVRRRNPMHHGFVVSASERLTQDEADRLEAYLDFCLSRGLSMQGISDCYLTIVMDTLKEQVFFRKHRNYRFNSFKEAAENVYFSPNYMTKYMYGLAISSFLWPNHLDMFRFFEQSLRRYEARGRYLEVGPGHGYFLLEAAKSGAFTDIQGVDISATSIDQTAAIIAHFAPDLAAHVRLQEADFLACDLPRARFDAVVMGEVLEHVEEPAKFLKRIRDIATPSAFVYVTTCVNAPAVDHIYLFRHPSDVEELIYGAGFAIADKLIRPYEGKSLDQSLSALLPINVAYVLRPH